METIGIAGLGLLGKGIATACLAHGFRVVGFTLTEEEFAAARQSIARGLADLVDRAGFPPELTSDWRARWREARSLDELGAADFVVESVTEDLRIKRDVYDRLEAAVRPDVPIASNTSALPISLLQEGRRHPERFVGMHWAEPAHATSFLEIIRGERTDDATFARTAALARRVGKDPSLVEKDVPGFIVNRLGYAMYREAIHLLESGVGDVETIDRSFRGAVGLWATLCGPFRWIDITGGPALYARAMAGVLPTLSNATELPRTLAALLEAGARGTIDGRGFYSYREGDREAWDARYEEHVWRLRELGQDSSIAEDHEA